MMITKFSNGQFLKKKNYKYLGNNSFYFDKNSFFTLTADERKTIYNFLSEYNKAISRFS